MTEDDARIWLVNVSLAVTGSFVVFATLAPPLGYPLEFQQAMRLTEIVLPVFLGYVGSAVTFLLNRGRPKARVRANSQGLLRTLVKGPVIVFAAGGTAALVAFGASNRASALPGTGMGVDTLALVFSILLGLLTVSTSALSGHLFAVVETEIKGAAK